MRGLTGAGAATGDRAARSRPQPRSALGPDDGRRVDTWRLGRLEHQSSVLIYGAALSEVSQDEAERSIKEALDAGINQLDVAAIYGEAELRLAP